MGYFKLFHSIIVNSVVGIQSYCLQSEQTRKSSKTYWGSLCSESLGTQPFYLQEYPTLLIFKAVFLKKEKTTLNTTSSFSS